MRRVLERLGTSALGIATVSMHLPGILVARAFNFGSCAPRRIGHLAPEPGSQHSSAQRAVSRGSALAHDSAWAKSWATRHGSSHSELRPLSRSQWQLAQGGTDRSMGPAAMDVSQRRRRGRSPTRVARSRSHTWLPTNGYRCNVHPGLCIARCASVPP